MGLICKHCGKEIILDSARITENGDMICSSCAREFYIRCITCNNYIPLSEKRTTCLVCDDVVYNKPVNNYSLKPIPRFKGKKFNTNTTGRYFGIEMEFNRLQPEIAFAIFNELYRDKYIYNKHDGSIGGGVEIVTNPMDIHTIKDFLKKMDNGLNEVNKIRGFKENAGIHIHVNRKSIDVIDIYKLSYLLNYDSDDYSKRIIYYLSGRNTKSTSKEDSYSYCKVGNMREKKKLGMNEDRYQALNLRNDNTIEFRIFKASADIKQIGMYVDLVNDMIEFCHAHGLKDINIKTFIKWELEKTNTNKLIVSKIKNFQKYNGVEKAEPNLYKVDISLFKGINIKDYAELIGYINYCSNIQQLIRLIDWFKKDKQPVMPVVRSNEYKFGKEIYIKDILTNTLKKVLVNKIMKGLKECA